MKDDETKKTSPIEDTLQKAGVDYVAAAARSALGAVPFAGSLLAEIAGNVIPSQRIDRLVKYAEQLEKRLSHIEESVVSENLADDEFTDLMEESLRQAGRSLSDERREYIAALVANSISDEEVEFFESKHLLRILGQLNDVEIIWLRSFLDPTTGSDEEFREKHTHILDPVHAHMNSSREELDKSTLQESYKEHLASLGLLEKEIGVDASSTEVKLKAKGYSLTSLGRLLLREIGFSHELLG